MRAVQQQVFWGVRLCKAPGTVGRISHAQPVQVGVEVNGEGMGVCLCCCPVSHYVSHDTDMGGHPLKVDVVPYGGQVEEKVMDDEGEIMVRVWVVGFYDLEGRE
ncbi:hypothetical protein E2C01_057182 [Portunus trituberculatus]|uniref:Uncharacterized protein n=1 Tax=Portunus trituberculatus TaxID=210409 RepID=A0A5B7GZP6_PORTR|nr:hypothetical protein [Portunus trituberculatus]